MTIIYPYLDEAKTTTHLTRSDLPQAIEALSQAFADYPFLQYLVPGANESRKQSLIHQFCATTVNYALPYRYTYTTPNEIKGVAAWIPPGETNIHWWRFLQAGYYKMPFLLGWSGWQRLNHLMEFEKHRWQDLPEPHWYLMLLGVAPEFQGQGIAKQLLKPILTQADQTERACYLETGTQAAVNFYEKLGFQIQRQERLGETDLPFWTMIRKPQPL